MRVNKYQRALNKKGFKYFKLYSDSTLKCLSKDYLISYIHMLHHNWGECDESYNSIMTETIKLRKELDNTGLKFNELEDVDSKEDHMTICQTLEAISEITQSEDVDIMLNYVEERVKAMERRLSQYREAIEGLGFKRLG